MNEHALKVIEYDGLKSLLAGYCASGLGRSVCEKMAPIVDRDKIAASIAQTCEMKKMLAEQERFPIGGLRDIRPHLKRMRESGHSLEAAEFREIFDTLSGGATLKKFLRGLGEGFPALVSLSGNLVEFADICNSIEFAIDRKGRVRDSASAKLSVIRRNISQTQAEIRKKAERIVSSGNIRRHLRQDGYSIRDGRCVLLVRVEQKYKIRGIIHDISRTGSTAFIEPEALIGVGNELSDLLYEQEKEVARILWAITFKILNRESDIRRNVEVLAWIDFTYAKARFSEDFRMTPPEINEEGRLKLRGARHPLLTDLIRRETGDMAKALDEVVPLDMHIGDDFDSLIITGPNTGGKTVALKTVGLLTAMALTGIHIPAAEGSEVAIFHEIFADIGDEQSIEQSLSTFSAHMTNIVRILNAADRRSLVLLDELGSGTDPAEGAALSEAILDSLNERQARLVVTTHLGTLKAYAYSRPRAENASMEFDINTLKPTYKMSIGMPGTSHAITIAGRLGMSGEIVGQARGLVEKGDTTTTKLIDEIQDARMALERNRRRVDETRRELEGLRDEAQKKTEDLLARKNLLDGESQHEIDAAIRDLKSGLAPFLKELEGAPKKFSDTARAIKESLKEALRRSPLAEKRLAYIHGLKKGQFIYVPRLDKRCRVKRVNKKRGCVVVYLGEMETEVKFDDITWVGQA